MKFSEFAPKFMERWNNSEYHQNGSYSKSNNTFSNELSLGTFSRDIEILSEGRHKEIVQSNNTLRNLLNPFGYLNPASNQIAGKFISKKDSKVIKLYSKNSVPFHMVTRGWSLDSGYSENFSPKANPYDNMGFIDYQRSFGTRYKSSAYADNSGGLAYGTVRNLTNALQKLPNYKDSDGLPGLVYRGAIVGIGDGRRVYGNKGDGAKVEPGEIVTNMDFMSTTAAPEVAGEFVMRQPLGIKDSMNSRGAEEASDSDIDKHIAFNANRVVFELEQSSGKVVAGATDLEQAEVLFAPGSLFVVKEVIESDFGLVVKLKEEVDVRRPESEGRAKNIMTGLDAASHSFGVRSRLAPISE